MYRDDDFICDSDDEEEEVETVTASVDDDSQWYYCEEGCPKYAIKNGKYMAAFKQESSLIRHYLKNHNKSQICCGETINDCNTYRDHLFKKHHNFNYQCNECPETFYMKAQLQYHIKRKHNVEPQKCPLCSVTIKDVESHIKNVHTGDPELIICTACPYSTRRKGELNKHYRKAHPDLVKNEATEICNVCGQMFISLQRHLGMTVCGKGKQQRKKYEKKMVIEKLS